MVLLIGFKMYNALNSSGFLTAAFIDIQSAYDSVYIPTLLAILLSYNVPTSLVHIIDLLLFTRELVFIYPLESQSC